MLTILSGAYPFAPVGPDAVGGAEQVLRAIDAALVREGYRSIVVAASGSKCSGCLWPTPVPQRPFTDDVVRAIRTEFGRALQDAIDRGHPDVVHLHGVDAFEYLPDRADVPIVVTLHLWPDRYPLETLRQPAPPVHIVCVSEAQRAACPCSVSPATIPNGVDLRFFTPRRGRERFVLLLGRICPEKAFHLAIDAATQAGLNAVVAGAVFPYPSHQDYFTRMIAPRLNGRVTLIEAPDRPTTRDLLRTAACVAIPSVVPETSSLVAMEALASGTPVVAFRTPALADLIEHGRTGFLVDNVDGMREAILRVEQLSSAECRKAAEERCAADRMTARYLRLYDALSVARGNGHSRRSISGADERTFRRCGPQETARPVLGA